MWTAGRGNTVLTRRPWSFRNTSKPRCGLSPAKAESCINCEYSWGYNTVSNAMCWNKVSGVVLKVLYILSINQLIDRASCSYWNRITRIVSCLRIVWSRVSCSLDQPVQVFEGSMVATDRTPWWWDLWCAETRWRFANILWTYFVHAMLVTQISSRTMHGAYNIIVAAPCFGYVKWRSSGCNYQKCKKEFYIAVL